MLHVLSINPQARYASLIVGGCFFMVLLDTTIIATSLPRMAEAFGVTVVELSIGVSAYLLAVAVFVPPAGWLADRFGARRIFLSSIVLFSLASLACGFAQTLHEFILARVVQGVGGALMTPVGRLIILHLTQKFELARAMTILTWPALTAPVLGPVVGGFITTYFDWRWNFFINLPLGVIAFLLAWRFIPVIASSEKRPFDWYGFILVGGGLVGVMYGLESFAHGWISIQGSLGLLSLGCIMGASSVVYLSRCHHPLLDLGPFKIKTFAMATVWAGTFVRVGLNAMPFVLPLLFQVGFGFSPFYAGAFIMVYFVGNLAMKTFSVALLAKYGFRKILIVNGVFCGVSIALVGLFQPGLHIVIILLVLFSAGLFRSLQFAALNSLTFSDIPDQLRSSASGLSAMFMQISSVLAVALSVVAYNGSRLLAQRTELTLLDFRVTFILMGFAVIVVSLLFFKLSSKDGVEVSGYQGR